MSKIKEIKKIHTQLAPVYDITTEKNHNFILKDGLVLHNCDTGQALAAKGYNYCVISVDRVDSQAKLNRPYQYFKSTIFDKRLEMYPTELLFYEITDLERNIDTGKVDHPEGSSKDQCDAVCGAIFNASSHAEEFAYDYGESSEQLLRLNDDNNSPTAAAKQLTLSLEEELLNMGKQRLGLLAPPTLNENTNEYNLYSDIIII